MILCIYLLVDPIYWIQKHSVHMSNQFDYFVLFSHSCYGAVQSLSGDAERDVAVEAVGQGECSLYSEDTITDEEGRFRLRGLLVRKQ